MRVGLIGYGAIGVSIAKALRSDPACGLSLVGVCLRPAQAEAAREALSREIAVVETLAALIEAEPDVVVEAAGHSAVRDFGEAILGQGMDLYALSAGALADDALADRLRSAAEQGGANLLIPAGAVAGIDGLLALRAAGLTSVVFTSVKPPKAWMGTAAEAEVDLAALTAPQVLFSGSAREAARLYPKNANLAATIALASLGLDQTQVRLIADPQASGNSSHVSASTEDTQLEVKMTSRHAPANPKTSSITGFSVVAALRNRVSLIRFA